MRNFGVIYWIRLVINVIVQKWVDREADQLPGANGIKLNTESTDSHDRQLRQAANREGSMAEILNGTMRY